ncbi:MAG: FAD-binding protein, partial [Rhizobiales bacterium]|nr:FAD-binding protein [Hyphomicrobiales bacterium]
YMMGGIRTDANGAAVAGDGAGETTGALSGLFAAGQAMGGLFGANRLGSTSLTEGAVFGARAGKAAADAARTSSGINDAPFGPMIAAVKGRFGQSGTEAAAILKLDLQKECWNSIGPLRTAEKLGQIDRMIESWEARLDNVAIPSYAVWNQAFVEFEELRNMLETAKLVSAAARERDGSLGGHVRLDCGETSAFSKPYSTVAARSSDGSLAVWRVARTATPVARIISYKIQENWRKAQIKLLRILPAGIQDKKLEARYRAIMGASGAAPEIIPGGADGAIGEATKA